MKKYALVNEEGTACSETTLCEDHFTMPHVSKVEIPYDGKDKNFVDVSLNNACRCIVCDKL